MPEFRITVSDIDYGAAAELLLRMIGEKADASENKALKLLSGAANAAGALPKKAVNALPQSVKDEILISLVNNYKDKLIATVESKAAAKGVALTIEEIGARKTKQADL